MKKHLTILVLCVITTIVHGQETPSMGKYSIKLKHKGASKILYLHSNKQGDILFYFEACKGAPGYNTGALYG